MLKENGKYKVGGGAVQKENNLFKFWESKWNQQFQITEVWTIVDQMANTKGKRWEEGDREEAGISLISSGTLVCPEAASKCMKETCETDLGNKEIGEVWDWFILIGLSDVLEVSYLCWMPFLPLIISSVCLVALSAVLEAVNSRRLTCKLWWVD